MQRLDGPNEVKVISVIEVKTKRGLGIEKDPVREITQYWDMDGNFLAERDSDSQLIADQVAWESERMKSILEDYSKNQNINYNLKLDRKAICQATQKAVHEDYMKEVRRGNEKRR